MTILIVYTCPFREGYKVIGKVTLILRLFCLFHYYFIFLPPEINSQHS